MRTFLENRLENFSLSVTALNHFLQDPKLFLERDLLQIPRSKESNLVYGNAVHDALKKWGLMVQSGKSPTEEDFLAAFRAYLDDREVLTEKDKSRLRALGEQALPRYFDARLKEVHPVIRAVEYPVNAYLDDIPLKGKLDRIDLISPEGSNAIVIDFKTGQPKTELQIREGDYFRQLTFYALLLSHQKKIPIRPVQYTLDFIGEREAHPIERSFAITEHEQKELEEIVRAVWAKILALDFTPI
jgi:ATP-dependent exoDNAse (exonuclease V) beta subunit